MANDDNSDSPIEDKKKPSGNFVSDMIWATVYVILAAYGSSSFIYMLHISNEEIRKFKYSDQRARDNDEFSVLSGSYIYGPPYFPYKNNVVDLNRNNPGSKNYSKIENAKAILDEQLDAIKISSKDSTEINSHINNLWNTNCPKKLDKFGKSIPPKNYKPKTNSDNLHDWLYTSGTFCNPQNLKSGAYKSHDNTWGNVTTSIINRLINSILGDNNPENLNQSQISYRKKLGYNIYKYVFFIIVGTMAFTRNLMNKLLQFLNFDNNEFKYWKNTSNPYSRSEDIPDNYGDNAERKRHVIRGQLIITLLFALIGKLIYSFTFVGGLFIGGLASIIFAFWNWNFLSMLTWWSASYEQGPFMWLMYSILSLLCWILGLYLMFIIPGFVGHIMSFIIPVVLIGTLFIYPFYDKTEVFVKNLNAKKYGAGNYALKKSKVPIESNAIYNKKADECQNIPSVPGLKATLAENANQGNGKYTVIPDEGKPELQHLLDKNICYEKYVEKLSGPKYIGHLVKKNMSLWMTLILHDLLRLIDADTSTHELFGQNITLVGDPSSSLSINVGTIPLLAVTFYKIISIIRNK